MKNYSQLIISSLSVKWVQYCRCYIHIYCYIHDMLYIHSYIFNMTEGTDKTVSEKMGTFVFSNKHQFKKEI